MTQSVSRFIHQKGLPFDRPKRRGRPLIFLGVILPISDTLFDSSQAQRLQNQSVYAEVVCPLSLYRSFLSLCYRRSNVIFSRSAGFHNTKSEGQALRVSLVKPGAYLSAS